jgi:guanyl-specific ribonuclease Sa
MQNNQFKNILLLVIGFILGFIACKLVSKNQAPLPQTYPTSQTSTSNNNSNNVYNNNQQNNNHFNRNKNNNNQNDGPNYSLEGEVPQKAMIVLKYIKENNRAMPNYVGGRIFTNRQKVLPFEANGERIEYQEWDVNEKIEGRNRGTERICTGSDGRSWYTNDHYKSFTLMNK